MHSLKGIIASMKKTKLRDSLQNNWSVIFFFFKVKFMKAKERLMSSYRIKESKEIVNKYRFSELEQALSKIINILIEKMI